MAVAKGMGHTEILQEQNNVPEEFKSHYQQEPA
jgi:hypothetical protein